MIIGIFIGLIIGIIGIIITFIICKKSFSKEHDYSELIKRTLEDLYREPSNNNSKKKH